MSTSELDASEKVGRISEESTSKTSAKLLFATSGIDAITVSLPKLLSSRMLITAASGGGKSYALRKILEVTANLVQQFIFDPEGEFESLKDKFNYLVINSRDSLVNLEDCSAKALAQTLLKNKTSAIFDISQLDPEDRDRFIRDFIEGMMEIEKEHWSHVIVAIDEAHLFAPQQDKSIAKKSLIDLACRGRKRGFTPIFATQRLAKLHKSVVAELQNRLVGQMTLNVDVKRAADELGLPLAEANKLLATLDVGEFIAYGPALTRHLTKIKIYPVETSHGALASEIVPPLPISEDGIRQVYEKVSVSFNKDLVEKLSIPKEMAEAHRKYSIIEPLLKMERCTKADVQLVASQYDVSFTTIYNWMSAYKEAGNIKGLVRKPRSPNKGEK